jgi:glutamate 5-kinase
MKREYLKDKKRIVIKIGSSSITHEKTGEINLGKIEKLVRQIADLKGEGREVVLVSSGAIAAGRHTFKQDERPSTLAKKQAFAAVGQAKLMMIYQRIFAEYNIIASQILMTKSTITDSEARVNAHNTFLELLNLGSVPIVNENDTIATDEIKVGDNDTLSAIVASLVDADLLILLSDIDGLYTDDPRKNTEAKFIEEVGQIDDKILALGKDTSSNVGTGGMNTKLHAAIISTYSGADMLIANASRLENIADIIAGKNVGTLFKANKKEGYSLIEDLKR